MFGHYLKIAFRNIRKYALQNIVGVLGLALGFVCLSLSIIWIRYENSFDTFHKDADRIYTVSLYRTNTGKENHGVQIFSTCWPQILELPELEDYTQYNMGNYGSDELELITDRSFYRFFDIRVAEGTDDFKNDCSKIAITRNCAAKLFPGRNPIGESFHDKTVCGILADFPGRSELKFDTLSISSSLTEDGCMKNLYGTSY